MREIKPHIRHTIIFQLFEHLGQQSSLQLISDHDPKPMRLQLEAKHGDQCRWSYLEEGPDIWRGPAAARAGISSATTGIEKLRW